MTEIELLVQITSYLSIITFILLSKFIIGIFKGLVKFFCSFF